MVAVTSGKHPRLTMAGLGHTEDDYRQLHRLEQFREKHPGVTITAGGTLPWQAVVPHANGETVITRYALRDLLDKLEDLLPPDSG